MSSTISPYKSVTENTSVTPSAGVSTWNSVISGATPVYMILMTGGNLLLMTGGGLLQVAANV